MIRDANDPDKVEVPPAPSRRAFLSGAGAAALAGLAACTTGEGSTSGTGTATESSAGIAPTSGTGTAPESSADLAPTPTATALEGQGEDEGYRTVSFAGAHQLGVLLDPASAGIVAAFDVVGTDRVELAATMEALSREIERLMTGRPPERGDDYVPPTDSGALGAESTTAGMAVTVAVGSSLFDGRFGLGDLRPVELARMPRFFNDRLVSESSSHGDLAFTITAPTQQAAVYGLHQIVRVTERRFRLRWVQEGYNQLLPPDPDRVAPTRNLMGFRDGTSNLDTTDVEVMDAHVWVQADDAEPGWATGGTYQAVRVIRMLLEFWATAALVRQEQIFGRHRASGAPLGQIAEQDEPAFATDQTDETIPRRAHLRLANPRTPGTGRILRRGFSYLNGAASDGTMDQGLLFIGYQRALSTGFLEIQRRLDGEPLEDYIKPTGGGLFFVLPGPGTSGGWLGQSLFNA